MSADELRQAAATLRERAASATPGPWFVESCGDFGDKHANLEVARFRGGPLLNMAGFGDDFPTAEYIATVHPGVGLALADWLDEEAEEFDRLWSAEGYEMGERFGGLVIARLINGGAA